MNIPTYKKYGYSVMLFCLKSEDRKEDLEVLNIAVNNVSFSYDEKLILSDLTLNAEAGAFVCLLGPSGCGKSTLLRLLAGLEKQDEGEILIDDKKIESAGLQRGVVFQDYGLFPWMTAGENITIALKQRYPEMKREERKDKAVEKMSDVGLDESVFDKLPKELSGGMKQRCAIARAFGIDPPVLLMDEPFAALDAVTRAKLQDLVLNLWKQEKNRKTVFFVTHDVDEALYLATDIYVLGQAPSKVIAQYQLGEKQKVKRENMYENKNVMELRNQLIKIINDEIQLKVQC